jgi:hypothetical protein
LHAVLAEQRSASLDWIEKVAAVLKVEPWELLFNPASKVNTIASGCHSVAAAPRARCFGFLTRVQQETELGPGQAAPNVLGRSQVGRRG